MLKPRLITAAMLVLLAVSSILWLPTRYFSLALTLPIMIGAWEWAGLIGLKSQLLRYAYSALTLALLWGAQMYLAPLGVITVACLWWLLALFWVLRFPAGRSLLTHSGLGGFIGLLVLIPPWVGLVSLHGSSDTGPYLVLFIVTLIWLGDTAAYFSGQRWGSRKLAPHVSPGKTWEGLWGAVVAVAAYALIVGLVADAAHVTGFILLCLVTLLFSVLGDLFESMFKRQAGVKDSGTLLPGHGGMLDRIDSLTAAAPIFVLGFLLPGMLS